jgi:5-methylcytosine-specific restriction endonuclease McrA
MQFIPQKTCTTCGVTKLQTTDFFNLLSSGHWRGSCKECRKAVSRKHHAENPSMTAARRSNYNDRKKSAIGSYTKSELDNLRAKQNNCCAYCGDHLNGSGELDHRTSLLHGGSNEISNLAWACRTCNRDKGSKSASEFFAWRKKLGMKINERVIFLKRKPPLV